MSDAEDIYIDVPESAAPLKRAPKRKGKSRRPRRMTARERELKLELEIERQRALQKMCDSVLGYLNMRFPHLGELRDRTPTGDFDSEIPG